MVGKLKYVLDHCADTGAGNDGIVLKISEETHWDEGIFMPTVCLPKSKGDKRGDANNEGAEHMNGLPRVDLSTPFKSALEVFEISGSHLPVQTNKE